jgi:ATP-dependent protease ClpP protease subunit
MLKKDGKKATLRIYGQIGGFDGIKDIDVANFLDDAQKSGVEELEIKVNSPGGYAFDGITIYNEFKDFGGKKNFVVMGNAGSAASVVVMAGDTLPIMRKASSIFIHRASGMTIGNSNDHSKMTAMLGKLDNQLAEIYAAKTGKPVNEVLKLMDDETTFTGEEAVASGFASKVMDCNDDDDEKNPKQQVAFEPTLEKYSQEQISRMEKYFNIKNYVGKEKIPMPETTPTPATVPDPPKAATIAEVKSICTDATPDFILSQVEKGNTADQVRAEWTAKLKTDLEALKTENAKLRTGHPRVEMPGVRAAVSEPNGGEPGEDFTALVEKEFEKISRTEKDPVEARRRAMSNMVAQHPDAHTAFLCAYNLKIGRKRAVRKFQEDIRDGLARQPEKGE